MWRYLLRREAATNKQYGRFYTWEFEGPSERKVRPRFTTITQADALGGARRDIGGIVQDRPTKCDPGRDEVTNRNNYSAAASFDWLLATSLIADIT